MEDSAHLLLRQALIRRLRILVPVVLFATALSGLAAGYVGASGQAFSLRIAGVITLLLFLAVALAGTVPINQRVLDWTPAAPPPGWRSEIARWERLDLLRVGLAMLALGLFVAAALS